MRKTSEKTRKKVVKLWLEGFTYRQIRDKLETSMGIISGIITEVREETPDWEEIVRLNRVMKREKMNVFDAMRGAKLLERLHSFNIGPTHIEGLIGIAERVSQEKNTEKRNLLITAIKLAALEQKTGNPYDNVVRDYEKKRSLNAKLTKKFKHRKEIFAGLKKAERKMDTYLLRQRLKIEQFVALDARLHNIGLKQLSKSSKYIQTFKHSATALKQSTNLRCYK